jgi:tRNA(Ile)-lysidine synthetase-like protein
MEINLEPGLYVIAVSGGVDSVALLHMLAEQSYRAVTSGLDLDERVTIQPSNYPTTQLIVAHYDHGIRPESASDRVFVQSLAKQYGLDFEFGEGALGSSASEASARQARYAFLNKVLKDRQADALITAHHQDDVIETAIINMIRGTGRKGLTALADSPAIRRPLLGVPKADILEYAQKNGLEWQEDQTNHDTKYLRNYIRLNLIPRLSDGDRKQLLLTIDKSRHTNTELDMVLDALLEPELSRQYMRGLSHTETKEIMAAWLRQHEVRNFDKKTLERLVIGCKVASAGTKLDVISGVVMEIDNDRLRIRKPVVWQKSRTEV